MADLRGFICLGASPAVRSSPGNRMRQASEERGTTMAQFDGVRVVVEGNLPTEVMTRLSAAARNAVLQELADIDTAPSLFEWPFDAGADDDGVEIEAGGAILKPEPPPDPFDGIPRPVDPIVP
jgi:hypothetical protein